MSKSFTDIDFSFEDQARERERERDDRRRRTITSRRPGGVPATPWKVTDTKEQPKRWSVDRSSGESAVFTESNPATDGRVYEMKGGPRNASRFELEVTTACLIGGEHAAVGDIVHCYGWSALALIGCERVRVIAEHRPEEPTAGA